MMFQDSNFMTLSPCPSFADFLFPPSSTDKSLSLFRSYQLRLLKLYSCLLFIIYGRFRTHYNFASNSIN